MGHFQFLVRERKSENHFIFIMSQVEQAQEIAVANTQETKDEIPVDLEKEETCEHESELVQEVMQNQEVHEPPQADNEISDQQKVGEAPNEPVAIPAEVKDKVENGTASAGIAESE